MGQTAREQRRTDVMLQAAKETAAPAQSDGILDRVPGRYREMLGELRALAAMSDLCRLAAIKRVQDLKAWCIDSRVSWEEVCDAALPKCRRTIDRYLDTLETFGDGSYEGILEMTSHAERVQARRLYKSGKIRQDGGEIVIGSKRIPNDAEHTYQIVEALREAFARAEAAEAEMAKEKALRKADNETGQRQILATHRALEAAQTRIRVLSQLQPPADLAADADRESWRAARQALGECDLHVSALAALAADPQRTDVLRARVVGHLRMLQGWIAAAVDEIAEQMPPEWAPTIEAEEQDCAVAPALPRELIEEVRQRTIAKGGLTLVPSVGCDNGHSVQTPSDITH